MEPSDFELLKSVDLYEILGFVSKDEFTPELAKKFYRKLALKFHPDKNPDTPQDKFEAIQLAYLILSTPEYKSQYDNIYEINSRTKDFNDLIDNFKSELESIQFQKISEEEFTKKIHELNIKNNSELKSIDVLDEETSTHAINKILVERSTADNEFIDRYKSDLNVFGSIINHVELNKKFNEMFDTRNGDSDSSTFMQTDLTVLNGCDTISNYTTLSNMNYNSMYAGNSTYEESFKLNTVPKYIDDNRSLEERMTEYLGRTNELASLAKNSTSANLKLDLKS